MNAKLQSAIEDSPGALRRFFMRRLRNPADVDDLAQQVYERLLATPDEKVIENPGAYLYGTAKHVLADHRLHAHEMADAMHRRDPNEDMAECASCILPDDMADRLNLQQQIDKALETLTPRQRNTIVLYARDGWTYDEIAALYNISWETVSRHLVDARMRIRTQLWER